MSSKTAVRLRVTGHVQGVSFRAATQDEASRLDLRGWVRNESDGSVSVHAEGDADALQELVDWCQDGPAAASVEGVEREDVEPEGAVGFEARE